MLAALLALVAVGPLGQPPVVLPTPFPAAYAVSLARRDAETLAPDVAYRTRYLSLVHCPPGERENVYRTLCGHLNATSREPDIVRPELLAADGRGLGPVGAAARGVDYSRAVLVRVNLDDYRYDTSVWEQLAEQDYLFHATVDVTEEEPWGYYRNGVWVTTEVKKKVTRKTALAPWCGPIAASLAEKTKSNAPILDARTFFWQTAIQFKRKVGYYGLLQVKDRKDFQRLVGFDEKVSADFSRELLASVAASGVADQPRRIARFEKIGGGYWSTFDNDVATDKANPLRVLDKKSFEHKAEEIFAHLPNGMWATFLCDANGDRQDSAPDFIGSDTTAPLGVRRDARIHAYLSCFRCHDGADRHDGLHDFKDWARNLFRPPLQLQSPDYAVLKELRQQYLRKLEPPMKQDRLRYREALFECNGRTPAEHSNGLAVLWADYAAPVTRKRAAYEVGLDEKEFALRLRRYLAKGPLDTALGTYLRDDGEPLPLESWAESYPVAQRAVAGGMP